MLVAVITYQRSFDLCSRHNLELSIRGTTFLRAPSDTLANATLYGSFPRAYLAREGNAT